MTKTFLKNHAGIRNWAGVFLLFIVTLNASAQLDSASVSLSFTTAQDPEDSLATVDVIEVNVSIYDIDFMGEVIVTLYDQATNYPLQRLKKSSAELIAEGSINGDIATMYFYEILTTEDYTIETQVRNFQGANLGLITTQLSN